MLDSLLQKMVDNNASDLFVTAGFPVSAKINGKLTPISDGATSEEASLSLVHEAMTEKQQQEFHNSKECNFAIVREGIGRFRCSAFWQRDQAGMVVRRIVTEIPKADDLGLPPVLKDIIMANADWCCL